MHEGDDEIHDVADQQGSLLLWLRRWKAIASLQEAVASLVPLRRFIATHTAVWLSLRLNFDLQMSVET